TFVTTANILEVNPDLHINTQDDLEKDNKDKNNEGLSYASAGPSSTGHLSGHILETALGVEMTHITYKSSGQPFPDVISALVSMVFVSLPSTIGHIKNGGVRPVVVMSAERSSLLPDIPTAAEEGYPDATMNFWMGIEGPKGMPKEAVDKLNAALEAASKSPELLKQLQTVGAEVYLTSPEEFSKLRSQNIADYRKLVKAMGLVQN